MRHIIFISVLLVVAITGCGHPTPVLKGLGKPVIVAPQGVNEQIWTALNEELSKQLATRSVSAPPTAFVTVTSLVAVGNGPEEKSMLTWSSIALKGDYNNDGSIDISDITPLAIYYGQECNSHAETIFVNGDNDPTINIADVTAIAMNFGVHLEGFRVWRGKWNGTTVDWETNFRPNSDLGSPNWSANRIMGTELETEYGYIDDISGVTDEHFATSDVRYKVTAFGDDADGTEAEVAMPNLPPLFSISGMIKDSVGLGLSGALVKLMPKNSTIVTTADGSYAFSFIPTGDYILSAEMEGHWFSPAPVHLSITNDDAVGMDFTGKTAGLAQSSWPKYGGNPKNTCRGAFAGPQTNAVKWTYPVSSGAMMYAGVTIGPNGIYAVHNNLFAVNDSGSERWTVPINLSVQTQSTCAIGNDGDVYLGCADNQIYAFSSFDGSLRWTSPTISDVAGIFSSPAISPKDGTIYAGSLDWNVYAFHPSDGSIVWTFPTGNTVYGSPAIGEDGTIFVGSFDKNLYAINPDGTEKWHFATGAGIFASASIDEEGTIYVASYDGYVYALHPDGQLKWQSPLLGEFLMASPVITDTAIYTSNLADEDKIYSLSRVDGSVNWEFPSGTMYGGNFITADINGTVYVASYNGNIYALNPDKSVKWEYTTGGPVDTLPAVGDGVVYIISNDGLMYCFGL